MKRIITILRIGIGRTISSGFDFKRIPLYWQAGNNFLCLVFLIAFTLFPWKINAQNFVVIDSFPSPSSIPFGLAWDGTALWHSDRASGLIYKLDPSNGSVISSFAPLISDPAGLAWDGSHLWCADWSGRKIYKLDVLSKTIVKFFPSPRPSPFGLAWDGSYLWCTEVFGGGLYKLSPNDGSIIQFFSFPFWLSGLAFDGSSFWLVGQEPVVNGKNNIYHISLSGEIISIFQPPGKGPEDLAWDGRYLWNCDAHNDMIYKISIPILSDILAGLSEVRDGSATWGDYDNDEDLDILLTGNATSGPISKIYQNQGGIFVDISASLTGVRSSSVAWGDYDNDNDLDILLTGDTDLGFISKIYQNESGSFVDISAPLTAVSRSSVAWGDYDNDGDLDILLTGDTGSEFISKIYQNESGSFVDISASLPGVSSSSVAWGDYDNDGDLDILLTGDTGAGFISKIYQNKSGIFVDCSVPLTAVSKSSVAWGDYDNDGDLDILLTGLINTAERISNIYRNDGGNVVNLFATLTGVSDGSVAWGDSDNDGDLDILLTGSSNSGDIAKIYQNNSNNFEDISVLLPGVHSGSVALGDYDNDSDLDILLIGSGISKVFQNNIPKENTVPQSPANLKSQLTGDSVVLSWDKSIDNETSRDALTYNLRIGKTLRGTEVVSPMANVATGYRKVPMLGNIKRNNWTVTKLPPGTYFWSVQAIDNAFAGSAFVTEESFALEAPAIKVSATSLDFGEITLNDAKDVFLWISNLGSTDLRIDSLRLEGEDTKEFDIEADQNIMIKSGESKRVKVLFVPHSEGSKIATLVIYHNAIQNNPSLIRLIGTAVLQFVPILNISTTSLDFDSIFVGSFKDSLIRVFNKGSAVLNITLTRGGLNPEDFGIISRPFINVEVGDSVDIMLRFSPKSTEEKIAFLILEHNASDKRSLVDLRGVGVAGAITVDPPALNFGRVNISRDSVKTVTIRNSGMRELTVTDMTISGNDSLNFLIDSPASIVLQPGEIEDVNIKFKPTSLGLKLASLRIFHDSSEEPRLVGLGGWGIDLDKPVISSLNVNPLPPVNFGDPFKVNARISDNFRIKQVNLIYRQGGQDSFTQTRMDSSAGGYEATVVGEVVKERGVEFKIEAFDGVDSMSATYWQAIQVRLPDKYLTKGHPGGSTQEAYRLISIPLDLDDPSVSSVLFDDLGDRNIKKWRLWDIDPQKRDSPFPYREYPAFDNVTEGKAMFLITREAKTLTSSPGKTVTTLQNFEIELQPGWNMIASPFNFDIPIANVKPDSLRVHLRAYEGNLSDSPPEFLEPWKGYLIKVKERDRLFIWPSKAPQASSSTNEISPEWSIRIEAYCENARDIDNIIGVVENAAIEWDRYERFQAPPIGEFVIVSFPHLNWKHYPDVYTTDFRPASADGHVWEFNVAANILDKVNLTFDCVGEVPKEFEVWLVDDVLRITQNLRGSNHYAVAGSERPKQLKLVVGRHDFIGEKLAEAQIIPTTHELSQNFPNPFNPSTTIRYGLPKDERVTLKIYNLLGAEVATLVNDEPKAAGYHVAIWDGRNQSGRLVTNGIYFILMRSNKFTQSRKMLLIE